jgi:bile acid:Na+ symporter, BASS family
VPGYEDYYPDQWPGQSKTFLCIILTLTYRIKDIVLLLVVFSSMVAGVAWPAETRFLGAFLAPILMGLLFLAFLKVYPPTIWAALSRYPLKLALLILAKLILLPCIIYLALAKLIPAYALGILLLAGVSTGLSASFFAGMIGASMPLVLAMTVVTTLLLPVTLPLIVKILIGRELHFDLVSLTGLLAAMIFVPFVASWLCRRLLPRLSDWVEEQSYPISLVLFAAMNLGAFGLYEPFLRAHQAEVVFAVLVGFGLAALLAGTGMLLFRSSPPPERIAAAGALGWINNVLIIVLGSYFHDPLTSVTAALYLIPYYVLIIPLSHLLRTLRQRQDRDHSNIINRG